MRSSSSANLSLVAFMLSLVTLGCISSNSDEGNSRRSAEVTGNNIEIIQPTPSPSPASLEVPPTRDLESPLAMQRVKHGEVIYERISSSTRLPVIFGWRARDITIAVPMSYWNGLSKEAQVDLTYYAEKLVQDIKEDPVPYATRWSSYYKRTEQLEDGGEWDGLYMSSYLDQVRKLCLTCWNITIGQVKKDGFHDESTPVSGGTVQEFRALEEKIKEKTSGEKGADEFKIFSSSMTADEHLAAAREALDSNYNPDEEVWGNTVLARKHIRAIGKEAPEYSEGRKLLQKVVRREQERKQFQDAVVRQVKRLAGGK